MIDKESAYQKIAQLVERFEEQYASYKNTDYNETLARRDFIDPFFKALQWDVDNSEGYAEAYREVIHEDKIKVEGSTKAPDYAFRLPGGKKLFFVEAKKPSIYIKDAMYPAYQVRRYGWSANLGVSVVTDFEEFAIYDCTKKPSQSDTASHARIKYITYKDYLKEFDFIWDTFSKEKVLRGSFDKFVSGTANKRGTSTVDKEFLLSLDNWRTIIAENIAKENKELNEDEINFAVQQTIDRIIFLRIAEDRSVEPYGKLKEALAHGDYYQNLFGIFKEADQKYNSGLFDLKKDQICGGLKVDNRVLKTVINELYYPVSPYQFSELPVEIIGSAYEQFLGKQIKIDSKHRAVIELKPEVRKAGGVYYTPQYIVNYIVEHTVGKLMEGKAPKEVSNIKIVDPACGSGSFLIGAYDYLLDWHKKYYLDKGLLGSNKKDSPLTPAGELTSAEKKRILLNNIYGVDLDSNAVEVTKLSLLLKCMEGETNASISYQFSMFNERILPTLESNIKSGNSLIDTDYYDTQIDFGEEKKIKPFNWQKAFPGVFAQGGFDAVIGNPPYGVAFTKPELLYILKKYPEASKFPDSYCVFTIRAKTIINVGGLLGFIVPNTFCDLENCAVYRKWFLTSMTPISFYQTGWAFKDAIVDTLVFISKNIRSVDNDVLSITIEDNTYNRQLNEFLQSQLNKIDYRNNSFTMGFINRFKYLKTLNYYAEIKAGVKLYEKGKGTPPQDDDIVKQKPFTTKKLIFSTEWTPLYRGFDIKRYVKLTPAEYVQYGQWLAAPRSPDLFKGPKILMRRTDDKLRSTIDPSDAICVNSCHVIKFKKNIEQPFTLEYLLALLNSKLFQKLFEIQNPQMIGKVFSEIKVIYVERLPIKDIDADNKVERKSCNDIEKLVRQLLSLHEERTKTTLSSQSELIQNRIEYCEDRINTLVYELYGLTEDEIRIVEGKAAPFPQTELAE